MPSPRIAESIAAAPLLAAERVLAPFLWTVGTPPVGRRDRRLLPGAGALVRPAPQGWDARTATVLSFLDPVQRIGFNMDRRTAVGSPGVRRLPCDPADSPLIRARTHRCDFAAVGHRFS
jgi:outer membrane scaffolding protein for murein synthesis (MipA/OmpV family)